MLIELSGGGGSVKSGTTEAAVPNNTIVIETGISNLKHFSWMAKTTNNAAIASLVYYDEIGSGKFSAAYMGGQATCYNTNIGTTPTAAGVCMLDSSTDIASGKIVIKVRYANVNAGVWFAE